MKLISRRGRVGIAVGASFVVFSLLYFAAPHEQICRANPQTAQKECAAYNMPLFLLREVGILFDDHNGAIVALGTLVVAAFTGTLWRTTTLTLKHLRKEFEAEHRPWVFIDNVIAEKPISWTTLGAHVTAEFTLRDAGRTPALNARVKGRIFPFRWSMDGSPIEVTRQRFLGEIAKRPVNTGPMGSTIALGNPIKLRQYFFMSDTDADVFREWRKDPSGFCELFLVGEVAYASAIHDVTHHTPFVFDISNASGGPIDPALSDQHIVFEPTPFTSGVPTD